MKAIVPREIARGDVRDIMAHYTDEAGLAVAARFAAALQAAYRAIASHPGSGSPRYADLLDLEGLRFRRVAGFPHLIFYVEHPDRVEVWRVLHGAQDIPDGFSLEATPLKPASPPSAPCTP